MSDLHEPAFRRFLDAFANHDYAVCVEQSRSLFAMGSAHEVLQIWLISLQRLGQAELARQLGTQLLDTGFRDPWKNALLKLTLGQLSLAEVLPRARDDKQRCQAHYYAGARLLTNGNLEAAHAAFAECLAIHRAAEQPTLLRKFWYRVRASPTDSSTDCVETYLALVENSSESAALQELTIKMINQQVAELSHQGRHAQALRLALQAYDLTRQYLGKAPSILLAKALKNLTELYQALGDYAAAESFLCQALATSASVVQESTQGDSAQNLNDLADLCVIVGNSSRAKSLYQQALDQVRAVSGEHHPSYATCLLRLAELHRSCEEYPAAEAYYRRGLDLLRADSGEEHPLVATSLSNLGQLHQMAGDYPMAEMLCQEAVDIQRRTLGEDHTSFAMSLNNLAAVNHAKGNYAAAEPLYRQSLAIMSKAWGESHPLMVELLHQLADLCIRTKRMVEAINLMDQAASIDDRVIAQLLLRGSEDLRLR
jgi:hypothetical protein